MGLVVGITGVSAGAEPASISRALQLAAEAVTAGENGDSASQVARLREAVELRPDVPQLLVNLAAAHVAAGEMEAAVAVLGRAADLGLVVPVERAEEFAALRGRKELSELVKRFQANNRPGGKGEIAFTLPDVTGLIEGIAWREATGEFYFGDVHGRAIWVRGKEGKLRRLTPEGDELLGVFGLVIDEANATLWAATSAVQAMRGYGPELQGASALAEIDLTTGALRRTIAPPPPARGEAMNQLGDLALGPDGTILVTDAGEPVIWRYSPGADRLVPAVQSPEFISLQGIAFTPAGVAVVADRINGLLRVEPSTGEVRRFESPANATLVGLDGVVAGAGNSVWATQSGTRPTRVLQIGFDAAVETVRTVAVREAAHLAMAVPALGCLGPRGDFYFVGNGGWPRFEDSSEPTAPRPVPIFRSAAAGR